ncbi:PQQ-dependent sugar dehydrogenase [Marinactinospora thermotolerans]|uniref:Glucose/arabinose dehydrogenase, beta-propeller fold n=1 Tax=Marinactinospora thermotolerans DSM 45154 TaxID=1122192 RepID=A0A1T4SEW1_9ACTN|nr:PQQ-dependent sugar dehydrogenase [Marinactinospora thermotolerans]SKA26860.1 Glucose/arabinose dehydrogenase, beta-propeller fold [Marinactinospora thermotolerans DSM 45154]
MGQRAWTAATVVVALLVAGCSDGGGERPRESAPPSPGGTGSPERLIPPGEPRDVTTGLGVPWSIVFLPDGAALVAERDSARVLRVEPDGATREAGEIEGVRPQGEGGLLGLAVAPESTGDTAVYAYFTSAEDNRIVRMPYDTEAGLGEPEIVVSGIPSASFHNGGRIAFGPDGMLYAGTGDAGREELARDTDSLGGKVLRMTPDGEPAEGNPFGNLVYSYGHRNVQGLAWDEEGTMYATEFGQNTYDEVNVIEPGGDYGWPEVEGKAGRRPYVDPVVEWTPDEASPSGAAVAAGSLWVAALRGERLWRIPLLGGGEVGDPEALFVGERGRLRAVAATPDGAGVWVSTSNLDGRGEPAPDDDRILSVPLTR